jgi:hypothetical protein
MQVNCPHFLGMGGGGGVFAIFVIFIKVNEFQASSLQRHFCYFFSIPLNDSPVIRHCHSFRSKASHLGYPKAFEIDSFSEKHPRTFSTFKEIKININKNPAFHVLYLKGG